MYTPNIKIKEEFYEDLNKILNKLDPTSIQKNWIYDDKFDTWESLPLKFNSTEMLRTIGIITFAPAYNSLSFKFYIEFEHPRGTHKVTFTKSTPMAPFFAEDTIYKMRLAREAAEDYQRAILYCIDDLNTLYEPCKSLNLYSKEKYGDII